MCAAWKPANLLLSLLQVTYLGKMTISGTQFLSGCTEKAVVTLVERHALAQQQGTCPGSSSLLEIRPFQVRLHHLDDGSESPVALETYQVARIAYCTADHSVRPNVFAWIYREINDDLSFQMDCHAVECESKLEAKMLAHSMMEAFRKTFHSMRSEGRIHKSGSTDEFAEDSSTPDDSTPDDG
uniref:Phosphotyrosine interaction domain containing 1 n=1 Tax=Oryzias sinensis TaxID=183150 RepID=A0A8C7Y7B3_9TELE